MALSGGGAGVTISVVRATVGGSSVVVSIPIGGSGVAASFPVGYSNFSRPLAPRPDDRAPSRPEPLRINGILT
jgi:hypothetical protein